MTTISAKTVLRSRNASRPDKVLSTLLLRYPRWVHAEVLTHRAFSRNSASSRAIPIKKMIEDIRRDPAMPIVWTKNEPGMQGYTLLSTEEVEIAEKIWLSDMETDIANAQAMHDLGAHKQIGNRLIEAHMHLTVLVSSTEWDNFLELRDHHSAEPHFQILAREIRKCLEDESTIQTLQPDEWHLPFITEEEWGEACSFGDHARYVYPNATEVRTADQIALDNLKKLSVARCASTSYRTIDGFDMTLERAVQIYDKLVISKPVHASPTEHVAQADLWIDEGGLTNGETTVPMGRWRRVNSHGNFVGFKQLRHLQL